MIEQKKRETRQKQEGTKVVTKTKRQRKRSEYLGPLHIENPDPAYKYFWPLDTSEAGPKCFQLLNNDWEFVTKEEGLKIGDGYLHETADGSIYRVPAQRPEGHYHFLMKLPKEWADEDEAIAQENITKREKQIFTPDKADGQYGEGAVYETLS